MVLNWVFLRCIMCFCVSGFFSGVFNNQIRYNQPNGQLKKVQNSHIYLSICECEYGVCKSGVNLVFYRWMRDTDYFFIKAISLVKLVETTIYRKIPISFKNEKPMATHFSLLPAWTQVELLMLIIYFLIFQFCFLLIFVRKQKTLMRRFNQRKVCSEHIHVFKHTYF